MVCCRAFALATVLVLGGQAAASAQNLVPPEEAPLIEEVRGGLHFHDVYPGFLPTNTANYSFTQLEDISFDVLFRSPDIDVFRWIGSPRPNFGGTISLDGQESMVHLGLTWQVHLGDSPVYLEGTLGAAAHNGYLTAPPPGFRALGCRVQFYEQFGIGADIGDNVTATLTYEHTSNWDLCAANEGLSNLGVRVGWKF